MDNHAAGAKATCPECGADHPMIGRRCWLCGSVLLDGAALPAGKAPEDPFGPSTRHTFSLISLFLVMTLAAVCLGVFAAAPGLGIVLALVSTPALVRTMVAVSRQKAGGLAPSPAQKVLTFAASLGVLVLAIVAGLAAFCAACFIGFASVGGTLGIFQGASTVALVGLCIIVGVGVPAWILHFFWARKKG